MIKLSIVLSEDEKGAVRPKVSDESETPSDHEIKLLAREVQRGFPDALELLTQAARLIIGRAQ
jgi:hypothetical protein